MTPRWWRPLLWFGLIANGLTLIGSVSRGALGIAILQFAAVGVCAFNLAESEAES